MLGFILAKSSISSRMSSSIPGNTMNTKYFGCLYKFQYNVVLRYQLNHVIYTNSFDDKEKNETPVNPLSPVFDVDTITKKCRRDRKSNV